MPAHSLSSFHENQTGVVSHDCQSALAAHLQDTASQGFGCGIVVPGTGVCLNNFM